MNRRDGLRDAGNAKEVSGLHRLINRGIDLAKAAIEDQLALLAHGELRAGKASRLRERRLHSIEAGQGCDRLP